MCNMITHKGYAARMKYDEGGEVFTGHIVGISDRVEFHADTAEGLHEAFREAVEDYIETCVRIGKEPQICVLKGEAFDAFESAVEAPGNVVSGLARATENSKGMLKNADQ